MIKRDVKSKGWIDEQYVYKYVGVESEVDSDDRDYMGAIEESLAEARSGFYGACDDGFATYAIDL